MNGRGLGSFAAKFRDQARDAVSNYKLPSFDDMAKNDDYIHSPDFNVRTRRAKVEKDEYSENPPRVIDEASYHSTESSSWSLLDRPSLGGSVRRLDSDQASTTEPTFPSATVVEQTPHNALGTREKSHVSLLSIVSATLQQGTKDTLDLRNDERNGNESETEPRPKTLNYGCDDYDSDSSGSSLNEEDDPIISMMLEESKGDDESSTQKKTKTVNRFLDDVRLQVPLDSDPITGVSDTNQRLDMTTERRSDSFGGIFKTLALSNIDKMKKGLWINRHKTNAANDAPPPLAMSKALPQPPPKIETFEITTSAGMLGEKDLKELQKLKTSRNTSICSFLGSFWKEHKQFLFVAFTLVLSIYVYFFLFHGSDYGM